MADGSSPPRLKKVLDLLIKYSQATNVAKLLDEDQLKTIGLSVIDGYEIDVRSNEEWTKTAKKSMDVALQVREAKNYPFTNASNVKWPLITIAALQFNARAYPAIMEGDKIVKAKVIGDDDGVEVPQNPGAPQGLGPSPPQGQMAAPSPPSGAPPAAPGPAPPKQYLPGQEPGAKKAKADRISEHMSYQLTEEMDGWEEDLDTLLMQLPIMGCAFKKVYWDGEKNCSDLISALDLIVNKKTRSLREAPRVTHMLAPIYPHEIEERQRDGRWLEDLKFGAPQTDADGDKDAPHQFIEQHRWIDLDGDDYPEPYIVTVHKDTSQVCRIVANFGQADLVHDGDRLTKIAKRDYFVKYPFIPDPKGGFYDIGFGQLLESISAAIDTTFNQMLDAGHLQNAGGGFIGSGVRLKKNEIRLEPGLYRTIDATGAKLRDAIVNMEHPGPSDVLFKLLGMMLQAAKDITAVQDILTGDSNDQNQTATTTLALIEQGLKVFTAIFKRVYRALKQEFRMLYRLNAEHLPEKAYYNVMDTPKAVAKADYNETSYDICPVADPKIATDMQKMARANVIKEFLLPMPSPLVNAKEGLKRYFEAAGIDNIDTLVPEGPQGPGPQDLLALAAGHAKVEEMQANTGLKHAQAQKTHVEAVATIAGVHDQSARRHAEAIDALAAPHQAQQDAENQAALMDRKNAAKQPAE